MNMKQRSYEKELLDAEDIPFGDILTTMTQERALDILKTGANVFLTGEPGAGKTYVINQYIAWLEAAGLKAKMLLQVHDELVFEAPEKEAKKLMEVAADTMAHATLPVLELNVPLVVEAKAAKSWAEAH